MAVILTKGQKIDLTKGHPELGVLNFGVGWGAFCDLDYGCACFDVDGKFIPGSFIYFGQKKNYNRSIWLDKDDTVGGGDPKVSKENCRLDLKSIPSNVAEVKFGAWVWTGCRNFGEADGAFMQLRDITLWPDVLPESGSYKSAVARGSEIANYYLSDDFSECTAVCLGSVYRHQGEWKTAAIGLGMGGGRDGLVRYFETGYVTPVEKSEAKKSTPSTPSAADAASRGAAEIGRRIGGMWDALRGRR